MSLKFSTRRMDDFTIVDLNGSIRLGDGSGTLRSIVRDLVSKGQKNITLNLRDVSFIDSSGIGELVSSYTAVRSQGGVLNLMNLSKKADLLPTFAESGAGEYLHARA